MHLKSGTFLTAAFSALATCVAVTPTQAALIGDTIGYEISGVNSGILAGSGTAMVVDPGVEVFIRFGEFGDGFFEIDVQAESFDLTLGNLGPPIGEDIQWILSDLDWITPGPGEVIGVTQVGGPASNINFTTDSITIITPTPQSSTYFFSFDIEIRHIPEPLTILGAGTAVGFGAFFKRKLNQKQKQDRDKT